jgi:hypothetical protein
MLLMLLLLAVLLLLEILADKSRDQVHSSRGDGNTNSYVPRDRSGLWLPSTAMYEIPQSGGEDAGSQLVNSKVRNSLKAGYSRVSTM